MQFMGWKANHNEAEIKLIGWVDLGVLYPDIAKRLGTTTGAVCGKVHRLKIGKGPRKPNRLFLKGKTDKLNLVPDSAFFAIMERQKEEAAARQGLTVTLDTSDDHQCLYVIGDPSKRQVCGAERKPGTPYCEKHAALCLGRKELEMSSEGSRAHHFAARRNFIAQPNVAFTPIDPRTFEEADDPELVASAA